MIALLLSPGENDQDYVDIHDPEFVAASLNQLSGTAPFIWHLDKWSDTAAGQWWGPRLRTLVSDTSEEAVARNFAAAQLQPYHSEAFQPSSSLPSQEYTFELVERAIDRNATFLAMIGWSRWLEAVPALSRATVIVARNPRNPYFTPRNLGSSEYRSVVERLR